MKNIFDQETTAALFGRIDALSAETSPVWGKMNASQMLAHCTVAYEMTFTDKHKAPNPLMKWVLKTFIKKAVVGEKVYPKNARTAPQFVIADQRDFEKEKETLKAYIKKTAELGPTYFEGKENLSFGRMTAKEWNNLFYKHLDHHLRQFGV